MDIQRRQSKGRTDDDGYLRGIGTETLTGKRVDGAAEGAMDLLIHVLSAHHMSLSRARADESLLRLYSALLSFLRGQSATLLTSYISEKPRSRDSEGAQESPRSFFIDAPLSAVEALAENPATPRRVLEQVATERFSVPRGSMRSFSNREMLIRKLKSLIENERIHETIEMVAKYQSRPKIDQP